MFGKHGIVVLALLGIVFSVYMIFVSKEAPPSTPILFEPPHSPYRHYVAGEGIVESINRNTNIGAAYADLIAQVFVTVGDQVKKDAPLFQLDIRQQEAALKTATEELTRACTNYQRTRIEFQYYEHLTDKAAVSKYQYTQALYAMREAQNQVAIARAKIAEAETKIERALITAPSDGVVLQSNVRVGEFANLNPFDEVPLIIFGDTSTRQIRVNVAEEDAWRIQSGAPATAFLRGNSAHTIPLTFSYIEPYIIPKTVLSGSDRERVDTRVLQVVYTFQPGHTPIYIGQLLDVYINAKPNAL